MVTEWAQFLIKITRSYIFVCDNCRSHIVKVVSHLLQAGAFAYLFSSLGNTLFMLLLVHVCICVQPAFVCVCAFVCILVCMPVCMSLCVCLCAWMGICITLSSTHPPLLFCFIFFLSPPLQETNTGSLCPPLDLPSVPGDQVGGKMLCRNARPSSGSWASVSSHY